MPSTQLRAGTWVLAAVSIFYLAAVFPLAYFRHDDWLILGNAIHHFGADWTSAFHPTLFYVNEEIVWFFRPFFKALVYVFYELLGFNYYLWLSVLYGSFVVSVGLAASAIKRLTGSTYWGVFSFVLLLACIHSHFGSLFWMGEGMMNCPQLLLLAANLYFFARAEKSLFWLFQSLAYFCFVGALGIKESSVFQAGFLGLILLMDSPFKGNRRVALLGIYGVTALVYLYLRLFVVPVNPYYVPKFQIWPFAKALLTLVAALSVPVLIIGALLWRKFPTQWRVFKKALFSLWPYLGFLGITLLPYLGHPFFSPGWLLLPSAYLALILGLLGNRMEPLPIRWRTLALSLLIVSFIPVAARVVQLRWWDWKQGQQSLQHFIQVAPAERVQKLVVYDCVDKNRPHLAFDRVIGFEAGLHHLWGLYHAKDVPIQIRACDRYKEKYALKDKDMVLVWKFPVLAWVNQQHVMATDRQD